MADAGMALLALLPLVATTVIMMILYRPATVTMPIAWLVAVAVGVVGWNMSPELIAAASNAGVFTATEILWIVFGAILLLNTLKQSGPSTSSTPASRRSATTGASRSSCWCS